MTARKWWTRFGMAPVWGGAQSGGVKVARGGAGRRMRGCSPAAGKGKVGGGGSEKGTLEEGEGVFRWMRRLPA